jgi:hypothetical protein
MLNWYNWKGNGWSMLVGPILGEIKRERKLINNGLKGKTNLCSVLEKQ